MGRDPAAVRASTSSSAVTDLGASPTREALRGLLCPTRAPACVVDRLSAAGSATDGARLYVARVVADGLCPSGVCTPADAGPSTVPGWEPAAGRYAFDPEVCGDSSDDCGHMDFVLVAVRPTGLAARLVTHVVIWDQGGAGAGEDVISIGPNRFSRATSGGSNDRTLAETTVQLDPPRLLARASGGEHMVFGGNTREQWSDESGSGFGFRVNDACGTRPPVETMLGVAIPVIALPDAQAWRTLAPGTCAAALRRVSEMPAVDERAHTIGPAPAPDASAPRAYLVESPTGERHHALVLDVPAALARAAQVWISTTGETTESSECFPVTVRAVSVPLVGAPEQTVTGLHVERAAVSDHVRLRLEVPAERFIAAVDVGDFRTLAYAEGRPRVEQAFSQSVVCEAHDGALRFVPRALAAAPRAMIDSD